MNEELYPQGEDFPDKGHDYTTNPDWTIEDMERINKRVDSRMRKEEQLNDDLASGDIVIKVTTSNQEIFIPKATVLYDKVCGRRGCSKKFKHRSRNAKFCSTACQQKDSKNKKVSKKAYDKNKGVERLYSRSHSMAVEILFQLCEMGERTHECESCLAPPIEKNKELGKKLEVHHKDLNWFNNCPSNIGYFCIKCHAIEHQKINALLKANNQTVYDITNPEMKPFFDIKLINKG